MTFLRPAFSAMFQTVDGPDDGAAQAVPGMAVMYAMFLIANVAFGFLRERDWRTWSRLRIAGANTAQLVASKLVPGFGAVSLIMLVVILLGGQLHELQVHGSLLAMVALVALFGVWLTACGAVVAGFCTTAAQATAVANLTTLALGGLGGVFIPVETLPSWADTAGRLIPPWWVMSGLRSVIDGAGFEDIISHLAVLSAWALATTCLGIWSIGRLLGGEDDG